tara:strand:+ start:82 stop:237 length:156 start_codon:yes stop_codon:yes gene_type:complete
LKGILKLIHGAKKIHATRDLKKARVHEFISAARKLPIRLNEKDHNIVVISK